MTPGTYTERIPTYTAVQWDGTDESATWILDQFPGAERDGDALYVKDALDRRVELDPDTWVLRRTDREGAQPLQVAGELFDRLYEKV